MDDNEDWMEDEMDEGRGRRGEFLGNLPTVYYVLNVLKLESVLSKYTNWLHEILIKRNNSITVKYGEALKDYNGEKIKAINYILNDLKSIYTLQYSGTTQNVTTEVVQLLRLQIFKKEEKNQIIERILQMMNLQIEWEERRREDKAAVEEDFSELFHPKQLSPQSFRDLVKVRYNQ